MTPAPRARVARRPVHGVLLLDKPLGMSSNQALQKAKWLLRAEKAGHTGTLDPLASGLLVICFGAATKFSQLHLDADKAYDALLRLGTTTTTADAEGSVVQTRDLPEADIDLQALADRFTGRIGQMPPMYSALKKDGKALYDYARAGEVVEREVRQVDIHALKLQWATTSADHAALEAQVRCSKGTYIRTLAQDIGEAMGCGAHLGALRRVAAGSFQLAQCITLQALESMADSDRENALLPVVSLLQDLASIHLDEPESARFLSGLPRRGSWPDTPLLSVYGPGDVLLGTGRVEAGQLHPVRLLNTDEIQEMTQTSVNAVTA